MESSIQIGPLYRPLTICDQREPDWMRLCCRRYQLILTPRYWATAGLYLTSRPPWSHPSPLLVCAMAPLPVPALCSATAALQSSGTAALSLFRVPRTDTASTWDMPKSRSFRVLLGYKCSAVVTAVRRWRGLCLTIVRHLRCLTKLFSYSLHFCVNSACLLVMVWSTNSYHVTKINRLISV